MVSLLADLPLGSADSAPERVALRLRSELLTYQELGSSIERCARGLCSLGLARQGRVAIYLNKRFETVISCFAAAHAGGVFVPVNPLLKAPQVAHILQDCAATVLITSAERLLDLQGVLPSLSTLENVVVVGETAARRDERSIPWTALLALDGNSLHRVIDTDVAAILYTSGSTGRPKGVVLSHRNMVTGAVSVA